MEAPFTMAHARNPLHAMHWVEELRLKTERRVEAKRRDPRAVSALPGPAPSALFLAQNLQGQASASYQSLPPEGVHVGAYASEAYHPDTLPGGGYGADTYGDGAEGHAAPAEALDPSGDLSGAVGSFGSAEERGAELSEAGTFGDDADGGDDSGVLDGQEATAAEEVAQAVQYMVSMAPKPRESGDGQSAPGSFGGHTSDIGPMGLARTAHMPRPMASSAPSFMLPAIRRGGRVIRRAVAVNGGGSAAAPGPVGRAMFPGGALPEVIAPGAPVGSVSTRSSAASSGDGMMRKLAIRAALHVTEANQSGRRMGCACGSKKK